MVQNRPFLEQKWTILVQKVFRDLSAKHHPVNYSFFFSMITMCCTLTKIMKGPLKPLYKNIYLKYFLKEGICFRQKLIEKFSCILLGISSKIRMEACKFVFKLLRIYKLIPFHLVKNFFCLCHKFCIPGINKNVD